METRRRMVRDTAKVMQEPELHVFFACLAKDMIDKRDIRMATEEAVILLDKFHETGRISEAIESFCLDVLTGRIAIFNTAGKKIN